MKREMFDGRSILIADDEDYVRHHLSKRLRVLGLLVLEAGSGREVLEQAETLPDLIIMDVRMPMMDGLETLRRLKSSERTSSIPVVLLSALAQREEIAMGQEAGAAEYIIKPITFDRLLDAIRKHLD